MSPLVFSGIKAKIGNGSSLSVAARGRTGASEAVWLLTLPRPSVKGGFKDFTGGAPPGLLEI